MAVINKRYFALFVFGLIHYFWTIEPAVACVNPYDQRSIFLQRFPKKNYGATFIGRVKINEIKQQEHIQIVTATILQSKTHSDRVNQKLILIYPSPTSCGPYADVGDRGLIMGKIVSGVFSTIVPFQTQDYIKGDSERSLEVGKILHTDEGSFYLKESESYL